MATIKQLCKHLNDPKNKEAHFLYLDRIGNMRKYENGTRPLRSSGYNSQAQMFAAYTDSIGNYISQVRIGPYQLNELKLAIRKLLDTTNFGKQ